MKQTVIYALDFDGVICDSAVETGMTAWKAAAQLWNDMEAAIPPAALIDGFRLARPIIETGYESILAMRMLYQGETPQSVLTHFPENKQSLIEQAGTSTDFLKRLFGSIRDKWIQEAADEWIAMNPLFPGIAEKLGALNKQGLWYVVTTKQERFVSQILAANNIALPGDRIFGMDRNMSKEAVLIELLNKHPEHAFCFVEDRLPTLLKVLSNDRLQGVKLLLASWGYNTPSDRREATRHPIEIVDTERFLSEF